MPFPLVRGVASWTAGEHIRHPLIKYALYAVSAVSFAEAAVEGWSAARQLVRK